MKQKYFFIAYEYTPFMCTTVKGNAVISEEPANLYKRTLDQLVEDSDDTVFVITNFSEIDKATYQKVKVHNPVTDYVEFSKKDKGKK